MLVFADGEAVVKTLGDKLGVRSSLVALQQFHEALGGMPSLQRVAMIVGPAEIAKPDPAVRGELAQVRPAIAGKSERQAELACRAPVLSVHVGLIARGEAAAVALRLLEGCGNIGVLAFCLHRGHRREPDEKDVVRRACFGGPFRDGHIHAFLRARTFRKAEVLGIDGPPCLPKLAIDDPARLRLIEMDGSRGSRGCFHKCRDGSLGLSRSLGLPGGETLVKLFFFRFHLGGHLLPKSLLVFRKLELGGEGFELLGLLVMQCVMRGDGFGKVGQLRAELVAFVLGRLWRNEGAALELRVFERAMEPDADLPRDFQERERRAMIPGKRVIRGVARTPDFTK